MKSVCFAGIALILICVAVGPLFGMEEIMPGNKPTYEAIFTPSESEKAALVSQHYFEQKLCIRNGISIQYVPIVPGETTIKNKDGRYCVWSTDEESSDLPNEFKTRLAPHGFPATFLLKNNHPLNGEEVFFHEFPEFHLLVVYKHQNNNRISNILYNKFDEFGKQPTLAEKSWMGGVSVPENFYLEQWLIKARIIKKEGDKLVHGDRKWHWLPREKVQISNKISEDDKKAEYNAWISGIKNSHLILGLGSIALCITGAALYLQVPQFRDCVTQLLGLLAKKLGRRV